MSLADRLKETPAGVTLCPLEDIPDPGSRGFVLEIRQRMFHGFVVRRGSEVFGYVDQCPHMGLPLARTLDDYLVPSGTLIACGWHGALFEISDGRCVGGPCAGAELHPWPVAVRAGMVVTA
ncbi:MAG: 2Fe-2S ferredoxin [Caulobacteraceae bacterium]|jgi:nitrite reductase/ring-hydroxylating ferredoxin subunit|nr:2Fe-2S ferredoxin [Caulobacteraceae bacterium]